MNGTTNVTSSNTWYRINRILGLTAGSGGTNAGTITVTGTSTSNVYTTMQIGIGQSSDAVYTVPYATTALVKTIKVSMARANGAAGSAFVTFRVRSSGGVYRAIRQYDITQGSGVTDVPVTGLVMNALTDVKITCESVSDVNTIINSIIELLLIRDDP